jgi:hypothetical protein
MALYAWRIRFRFLCGGAATPENPPQITVVVMPYRPGIDATFLMAAERTIVREKLRRHRLYGGNERRRPVGVQFEAIEPLAYVEIDPEIIEASPSPSDASPPPLP